MHYLWLEILEKRTMRFLRTTVDDIRHGNIHNIQNIQNWFRQNVIEVRYTIIKYALVSRIKYGTIRRAIKCRRKPRFFHDRPTDVGKYRGYQLATNYTRVYLRYAIWSAVDGANIIIPQSRSSPSARFKLYAIDKPRYFPLVLKENDGRRVRTVLCIVDCATKFRLNESTVSSVFWSVVSLVSRG